MANYNNKALINMLNGKKNDASRDLYYPKTSVEKGIFSIKDKYGDYRASSFSLDIEQNYLLTLENTSFEATCPYCNNPSTIIHQTSKRTIIDTLLGRVIKVKFNSRKFKCKCCGKIFTEEIPFTISKCKYSARIIGIIIKDYEEYSKMKYISKNITKQELIYLYATHFVADKKAFFENVIDSLPMPITTYDSIVKKYKNINFSNTTKKIDYSLHLPNKYTPYKEFYDRLVLKNHNKIELHKKLGNIIEITPGMIGPKFNKYMYKYDN